MMRVRGNEGSSLVSNNLDRRISSDRAWRAANIRFHHVFAAYHHWICSPRLCHSHAGCGSDSETALRPLQGLSVGLVLLIVVQIILGFTTLSTGNQVIAWVHLLVAMGIYGMAIAGTFMSMRLNYRSREQSVPSVGPQA